METALRIAHVTSAHPRFDVRIFHKECVTLAADGYDVSLVVADGKGDQNASGVAIRDIGAPSGGRLSRMVGTARAVFLQVRKLNPDVVQFHDPELLPGACQLAKAGYKVVYDVHEDVPRQILSKHWIPQLARRPIATSFELYENRVAALMAAVVCATPLIRNRFSQHNSASIAVCNFPIVDELMRDVPWSDRADEICYVGDITRIRGIEPLLRATAMAGTRLNLAGRWNDDGLRRELVPSDAWKCVNELGFISRDEIAKVLARSKIGMVTLFENPNDMDSLPIKMFEYMAAGLPVIASDYPVWREIIDGAGCGILVNPHDAERIATAIRWLLNDPNLAHTMGKRGQQAVAARYNWSIEGRKLVSLYKRLKETGERT